MIPIEGLPKPPFWCIVHIKSAYRYSSNERVGLMLVGGISPFYKARLIEARSYYKDIPSWKMYYDKNYVFDVSGKDIIRLATKDEIKKGKQLIKKWKMDKLVAQI
jgi:hypothetical protein